MYELADELEYRRERSKHELRWHSGQLVVYHRAYISHLVSRHLSLRAPEAHPHAVENFGYQ